MTIDEISKLIPDEVVEAAAREMWNVECDFWRERRISRSGLRKTLPAFDNLMSQRQDDLRQQARAAEMSSYPGTMLDAANEITTLRAEVERLRTEVQTWQGHAKTAIWSDSEECKLLTRINAALLEAPTVDVEVVVPDRDYVNMTPKDCYEAGLLDGVHQAREAIKAATRAALEQPHDR